MKLNSPQSIKTAEEVFRAYGSWTAARAAAIGRDPDGVLVIPKTNRKPAAEPATPMNRRAG